MHSTRFIPNTPACEAYDTVLVEAVRAKADLQIDSLGLPKYQVWNKSDSSLSSSYIWRVFKADGSVYSEVLVPSNDDPRFNYGLLDLKNDTGNYLVCVWAMTAGLENCYDSACKMISNNFTTEIEIPNVFTPNGDNINDTYKIKVSGEELFELTIWNRWGGKVFETTDPKNGWNGKVNNTGENSPEGTYYFILTYRLRGQTTDTVVRGTVTLIRN
jgi:gliding motility-associated-like protein